MKRKRLIGILLALALVAGLAGCGREDQALPASDAPERPSSLEVQSSEPETPEEEWPEVDDALVREILKTYGAEEDGSGGLVVKDGGLLQDRSNWDSPRELSPLDYYCWFLTTTYDEDPAYKEEHYADPLGYGGLFFPQDLFEERVQKYFRVSARHLRQQDDYPCYDPKLEGYTFNLAVGIGETAAVEYSWSDGGFGGGIVVIDVSVKSELSPGYAGQLCVSLSRDGGWNYLWWQYRPDPMPEDGMPREEVDFLTQEQWELLDKAMIYYGYFSSNVGRFQGDSSWEDSAPEQVIDGVEYLKYTGEKYQSWEDFYQDMCSVFTPEYFELLNSADFGLWGELTAGPYYRNVDGDLYCVTRDGGGTQSYLADRDRYFKMLADEETIYFLCRSFYCEREDVGKEDPKPTSMKDRYFRLKNGPEGWRVDLYERP